VCVLKLSLVGHQRQEGVTPAASSGAFLCWAPYPSEWSWWPWFNGFVYIKGKSTGNHGFLQVLGSDCSGFLWIFPSNSTIARSFEGAVLLMTHPSQVIPLTGNVRKKCWTKMLKKIGIDWPYILAFVDIWNGWYPSLGIVHWDHPVWKSTCFLNGNKKGS
jgi:hypothetical protein